MSKFFIMWRVDNSKLELPTTPTEIGKLFSSMLKMIEEDLHNGSITDWGQFGNGTDGYALSELDDKVALAAVMFKLQAVHHMGHKCGVWCRRIDSGDKSSSRDRAVD